VASCRLIFGLASAFTLYISVQTNWYPKALHRKELTSQKWLTPVRYVYVINLSLSCVANFQFSSFSSRLISPVYKCEATAWQEEEKIILFRDILMKKGLKSTQIITERYFCDSDSGYFLVKDTR